MLVGATGSGKSTLVDGIVNYVMGVSFDDPFRFTIVQLEEEEKKTHNQVIVVNILQFTIFFISVYLLFCENKLFHHVKMQTFMPSLILLIARFAGSISNRMDHSL